MKRGMARMSSFAYTIQHLLARFNEHGCVNIGGRRINCIRFANDTALLAEDERMLKNMLMELNNRCEDYRMKNVCIFEVLGRVNISGHWRL